MRGQLSFEYIMVTAFVALMVLAFFTVSYIRAQEAQSSIDEAQIQLLGRRLVDAAESVYFQGPPSRLFVEERIPATIQTIDVVNDGSNYVLRIIPKENKGISEITFPSDVPIEIFLGPEDIFPGKQRLQVAATDTGVTIAYNNPYEFWYRFDDVEQAFIRDYSGNGITAVYNLDNDGTGDEVFSNLFSAQNVNIVEGAHGTGAKFSGSTDNEFVGAIPSIPGNKLTVTTWFKQDSDLSCTFPNFCHLYDLFGQPLTGQHVVTTYMRSPVGTTNFYATKFSRVDFASYDGIGSFTLLKTDNSWHHLAVTFDGTDIIVYLDGQLKETRSIPTAPAIINKYGDNAYLGDQTEGNNDWTGNLDEFRIYDVTLSPSEIVEDMNSAYPLPLGVDKPRPITSYSFESTTTTTTTALDTKHIVKGAKGGALSFDGVDDVLKIPDNNRIDVGEGDFTLGVDMSSSVVSGDPIPLIRKFGTSIGYGLTIVPITYSLAWDIVDSTGAKALSADGPSLLNGWRSLRAEYDRQGNAIRYLGNSQYGTVDLTPTTTSLSNNGDLIIGYDGFGGYYAGLLDEIYLTKQKVDNS